MICGAKRIDQCFPSGHPIKSFSDGSPIVSPDTFVGFEIGAQRLIEWFFALCLQKGRNMVVAKRESHIG
jgi:hypothetical protein